MILTFLDDFCGHVFIDNEFDHEFVKLFDWVSVFNELLIGSMIYFFVDFGSEAIFLLISIDWGTSWLNHLMLNFLDSLFIVLLSDGFLESLVLIVWAASFSLVWGLNFVTCTSLLLFLNWSGRFFFFADCLFYHPFILVRVIIFIWFITFFFII